ncbi:hypothetical protein C8R44DRAFT_873012 [Mycena epipterygia]|nr:hypothetical protein C8R44DRAFT_873012 [Mycena epipterygia]
MPQPASFLRSWRKKTHPQTSPTLGSPPADTVHSPPRSGSTSPVSAKIHPTRRPSDTPSETSHPSMGPCRALRRHRMASVHPIRPHSDTVPFPMNAHRLLVHRILSTTHPIRPHSDTVPFPMNAHRPAFHRILWTVHYLQCLL